jgi:hypothetical protein
MRTVVAAAAAAMALAAGLGTAAGLAVAWSDDEQQTRPTAEVVLEAEIAAMEDSGIRADHPKLEMLRDELAAVRAAARRHDDAPAEPGVDLSDAGAAGARRERHDATLWDDGLVECEPIPPDLLTAAEIAGATCRSLPQPDGTSLYVATAPDGTEHVVRFGADGSVTRQR